MLKRILFIGFIGISSLGFSQEKTSMVVKGLIFNSDGENLQLMQQTDNTTSKVISSVKLDKKGTFEFDLKDIDKDYYYLKLGDNQTIPMVIKDEDTIKVYGDGKNLLYNTNVINSDASSQMIVFSRAYSEYKHKEDSAQRYLEANKGRQREIQQEFAPLYQQYQRERQYYINVNSSSPALISAISTISLESEFALYESVVEKLKVSFGESPTVKRLSDEFEFIKSQIRKSDPFAPGNEVPEIALPNPEGDTLRLSDYRGKVVLLDFWAAWCGPCRRENPNVVKAYNKYKDHGFDVFNVSLDKTKEAWVGAIEKDGLIWKGHVSDLNGWQSVAAKEYGVNSIPFTILLDREGKVIGKNLRGQQLEQTLQAIFE